MRDRMTQLVDELLDAQRNHSQLDIVDDFGHPLAFSVNTSGSTGRSGLLLSLCLTALRDQFGNQKYLLQI